MPTLEGYNEVPSVFIDMPRIEGFQDLNINEDVTLEIKGKLKSLSQNEENQSMRLEVSDVEIVSKERNDDGLTPLRRAMSPSENRPIPNPPGV